MDKDSQFDELKSDIQRIEALINSQSTAFEYNAATERLNQLEIDLDEVRALKTTPKFSGVTHAELKAELNSIMSAFGTLIREEREAHQDSLESVKTESQTALKNSIGGVESSAASMVALSKTNITQAKDHLLDACAHFGG